MIDTNTMALAQQLQDIRDGYTALLALWHQIAVGGSVTLTALAALAWKFRDRWTNKAVLAHIEAVAVDAVAQGKGMAQTIVDSRAGTGDGGKP